MTWDDAWPRVTAKARGVLRNRSAAADLIEDAFQSAALHLLDRAQGFDSFEGVVAWVIEVAWNEIKMAWRRQARVEVGEVPERPDGPDPATVVATRLDLDAAVRGLALLSDPEREAILSTLGDRLAHVGPHEARVKMRRSRARKRLAKMAGCVSQDGR